MKEHHDHICVLDKERKRTKKESRKERESLGSLEGLNSNSGSRYREQQMESRCSHTVGGKGQGGNLEMETKGTEGMNDTQHTRFTPFIVMTGMRNQKDLKSLSGQAQRVHFKGI